MREKFLSHPLAPARLGALRCTSMLHASPSGGRALFYFLVIAHVLRRFPTCTGRHMARLADRLTVDDVTTFKTTAYHYTSRAQSATREPM